MPGQRGSQKSAAGDAKSEDAYNKMASRPGSQRAPAGPSSVPTTNSASIKKASPCVQASSSSASKNGTSGPSRTNTGGSNATTSSASSSGLTRFPATQHAQPVVIEIDDDDDDAPEIIEPIQATTQPDFIFYGTFQDIVVGIDYYNGVTTRGEQVLVVREPNNKVSDLYSRLCSVHSYGKHYNTA